MIKRPWGQPWGIRLPLITAGAAGFKTTPTLAAGDVKVHTDRLASANPATKGIAFTSGGTSQLYPGDTVTGATSAATGTVTWVFLTSGTWAGGDAAGFIFIHSDSGTFQAENLDANGSRSNICTIGGALPAAGIPVDLGNGFVGIAIPPSTMACEEGSVAFRDAAGAEWEDTAVLFYTEQPQADFAGTGAPTAADATTATLKIGADSDNDAYKALIVAESGKPTIMAQGTYVGATRVFTYDPAPGVTFTTAARIWPVPFPYAPTASPPTVIVGSLATQAKADVNAEVLDVLNVDTFAEPGQASPAATASLATKIGYLYKNWRNRKTQTATAWSLYADDATTVDQKATVADNGTTASKTEIETGP